MTTRHSYEVSALEDAGWWFVQVPQLGAAGQARSATEIEEVAREIIGLWLDIAPDAFDVAVTIEASGNA